MFHILKQGFCIIKNMRPLQSPERILYFYRFSSIFIYLNLVKFVQKSDNTLKLISEFDLLFGGKFDAGEFLQTF